MFSEFGPSFFGYGSPGRFRQGAPSPQQFGRQVDRGFGTAGDMSDVFDIGPFGLPLGLGRMPSFGLPSMPSLAGPPTTAMGTQAGISGDPGEGRVNPLWVDVFEAPDHFRLVADIPGVRKENVKINLQRNNILCIQADRMFPRPDDEQQILSCERDYGRYRRHLRLPADCDRDKMQAKCLDGQLVITIPRRIHGQIEEQLPEERVSVPLRDKSVEQPRVQPQEQVSPVPEQQQAISPLSQQRQFEQQPQQQPQQGQVPSLLGVGGLQKEKEREREIEKEKQQPSIIPSQPTTQQWEKEKEYPKEKEKEYPTQWQKEKEYPATTQQQREPMDLGISDVSGTARPSVSTATTGAELLSDAGLGRAPTVMPQQQQPSQLVQEKEKEKEKQFQQPQVLPQVQPLHREEKRDFEQQRGGITEKEKEPFPAATTAVPQVTQPPSSAEQFGVSQAKPDLLHRKDKPEKEEYEKEQMRGLTQQPQQPVRPLEREQIQPPPKISDKLFGKDREEPSYAQVQEKPSMMEKVKGALGLGQKEREKEPISSYAATPTPTQEEMRGWEREREHEKPSQPAVRPFDREKDRDFFGREREREREPKISEKLFGKEREEPTSYGYGQVPSQEKPSMMEKVKGALGLGQKEREKEPISSYTATPIPTQGQGKEKEQLPLGYKEEREQDKISPVSSLQGQEQQFRQYPSTSSYGRDRDQEERGWEREREKPYQPTTGVSSMQPPLPQQQKWESQGQVSQPSEIQTQTQQQGLGVQPQLGVGQLQKSSLTGQQELFGVQSQPTSVGDLSQGMQQRDTAALGRGTVPESQPSQVPSPGERLRRAAREIPVQLGIYRHST